MGSSPSRGGLSVATYFASDRNPTLSPVYVDKASTKDGFTKATMVLIQSLFMDNLHRPPWRFSNIHLHEHLRPFSIRLCAFYSGNHDNGSIDNIG